MTQDATIETNTNTTNTVAVSAPRIVWRRIAFWSIFPAVLVVPVWFAFGRAFFGAGGWFLFYTTPAAVVAILPYQLILMVLALVGKKGYLSLWASGLLLAYYVLLFTLQMSLVDGGDTEASVGSVWTFAGMSEAMNGIIFGVSLFTGFAIMVALLVVLIIDTVRNRRAKLVELSNR